MPARRVIATVLCHGGVPFEVAVTAEVFGSDRSDLVDDWYDWKLCMAGTDATMTTGGVRIGSDYGIDDIETADTVIVTPSDDYPEEVLAALRRAHGRGARMVSLCTGVFGLAASGLLDGRRVTTHWMYADDLVALHPSVEVDPSVLYIDDGDVLTSAGTAASIDLCLYIVRQDFGAEIANAVARRMVVPPHRDGGQAQYVDHPVDAGAGAELFADTLAWAEENLRDPVTVDQLAARAAMSPRTFARRFSATTGTTPHQWLTQQRVHLAQRLLETTDLSIEHIAGDVGLGTAANLRIHFQRLVHTTPSRYRSTFNGALSA